MNSYFETIDDYLHIITRCIFNDMKKDMIYKLSLTVNNYCKNNEIDNNYVNQMTHYIEKYCITDLNLISILFNQY